MTSVVDHLVYATPDLEQGIDAIEELLGVRPAAGGKHTGLGTHNALLGLGEGVYIEVIAPDPEQPPPERPLPFGLATLRAPRLATFCIRTTDIDELVASARKTGYDPGNIVDMSRQRPDGTVLRWRLAFHEQMPEGGTIPFVIDWGDTPHPSVDLQHAGTLADLRVEHPEPDRVKVALEALGIDLHIAPGRLPAVSAIIDSHRGRIELR